MTPARNVRPNPTLPSSVEPYVLPVALARTADSFVDSYFVKNYLDPKFGSSRKTLLNFWLQNLQSEGLCDYHLLAKWVRFTEAATEERLMYAIESLKNFFENSNWSLSSFEYFSKSLMMNSVDSPEEPPVLLNENEFRVLVSVLIQSNVDTIIQEKNTQAITSVGLKAFRELYAVVLSARNSKLQKYFEDLLAECEPFYAETGDLKLAVMGSFNQEASAYLVAEMSRLHIGKLLG